MTDTENAQASGMPDDRQSLNVLVTGGTQGVGFAIAERLRDGIAGAIVIASRDAEKGEAAAARLSQPSCPVTFVQCDLSSPAEVEQLFANTVSALGHIDCLVNAAGITNRGSVADGQMDDWDLLFAVNARAPFLLMQHLIGHALARRAPASIVNILSMNAYCGRPNLAIYAATKAALMTLTRNAANAHLADRIRVNGIAMGWAATPAERLVQEHGEGRGADWERAASAALPLGRLLTVEEVAETAHFLLSPQSGLITGNIVDLEQWVRGAPPGR